jgi:hypothetical protein
MHWAAKSIPRLRKFKAGHRQLSGSIAMAFVLHQLLSEAAQRNPRAPAVPNLFRLFGNSRAPKS